MPYLDDAHAIQSGLKMQSNFDKTITDPMDIRVGVNMLFVQQAALADLLMQKGIFTLEEYMAAMDRAAKTEKERLEKLLSEHFNNTKITLH